MDEYLQQEIRVMDGCSAAVLPAGMYEAKLADPHLQFLFMRSRRGQNEGGTNPARSNSVAFRVTPSLLQHQPGANRFTYLPHSHVVDHMYTDNTAQKFVGKGGTPPCLQYDIYVRRKPQLQV